jgi:predicted dehydrogenase
MKASVIGLGQMGLQHSANLSALTNQPVCVYDSNQRLVGLAAKLAKNLCAHNSLEELLAHGDAQIFYVCTPVQTHKEVVEDILKTRSDVALFVEKPLSYDYSSANRIARMANSTKRPNMVGFQKRFNGVYSKLKEFVDTGILGDIRFYRAHSFSFDVVRPSTGWKFQSSMGGVTLDFGAHMIDILIWLFGEPHVLSSSQQQIFSNQVEDYIVAVLENGSFTGVLEIGWCMRNYFPNEHLIEIHGTRGTATATDDEVILMLDSDVKDYKAGITKFNSATLTPRPKYLLTYPEYVLEDQYFIECASTQASAHPSFEDAAKVNKLVDDIRSKATG